MTPKITLIGLGNILLQDEGVGVHAVRQIQERYETPPELEIVDGGTSGLDLLPYIEGRDRVLFVDAVKFGQEPGYIGILENEEIPAFFAVISSLHHLGLADILAAAQLLGTLPPEICLIGIQPYSLETDLELSPHLKVRLEALLKQVLAKLQDWGLSWRLRPAAGP
ncbi:MAG: HyaD/HybD family hydrogenase maturation endopeptidase [Thermodesulfobacteriota bacterium]